MKQQRLKYREVAEYRKKLLAKQKGLCKLCGLPVKPEDATLDHCHDTGHVRAVLHRSCNQVDGRILSWIKRAHPGAEPLHFLQQLIELWSADYSGYAIHPNGTDRRKRKLRSLRKRLRNAKLEKTRKRLKHEIRETLKET